MRRMCNMPCAGFVPKRRNDVAAKIDSAGWGLFLLWVGVAFLLDFGWGSGLLGVGILTLAMQVVRRGYGLQHEGFWVLVGAAFTLAGLWKLAAIEISLAPILLMGCGVVILASALRRSSC